MIGDAVTEAVLGCLDQYARGVVRDWLLIFQPGLRLAKYALLRFRNMLIAKELPTEDVNALLLKLYK